MMCRFLHTLFCSCFHSGRDAMNVITRLTREYQNVEEALVRRCLTLFHSLFLWSSLHYSMTQIWFGSFSKIKLDQFFLVFLFGQINSGRYDRKKDFAVVLQPFMKLFNAHPDPSRRFEKVIDISFITHDCFHFSQKGHALGKISSKRLWFRLSNISLSAANMLWNNLMEPVGRKSSKRLNYVLEHFKCPSEQTPFLFTAENSRTFLRAGHQWLKLMPRSFFHVKKLYKT